MPEFLQLVSCEEADEVLTRFGPLGTTTVPLAEAPGRILSEPLVAAEAVPAWPRARMDGYAVCARDTHGASEGAPGYLRVLGTVHMGEDTSGLPPLGGGECRAISTGGMLPPGADGVLMVEYTAAAGEGEIEVHRAVAHGEHVLHPGEDVEPGTGLLAAGRRLGAPELAVLATCGVDPVPVFERPRVAILPTGDEIVPVGETPAPGRVRDANTWALTAQVRAAGAEPVGWDLVADEADALREAVGSALRLGADLVLVSGGSSVGTRDVTAEVLSSLEPPGILLHGINIRPGKPTIVADIGGRPVIGMPGYPVSAMVVFHRFLRPLVWRMGGVDPLPDVWPRRGRARLATHLHSVGGREDYVPVRLEQADETLPLARPLLGGSAVLTSLLGAAGVIRIDAGNEGLEADEVVEVLEL